MSTKIKRLILKGIIISLISIPMCAKLINLSKYEGNLSQYSLYLGKGENAYPGTLIRLGNKGENVSKIQQRLNELGFNAGSVDGIFGNGTKTAVINFQKSKGLDEDGIIGSLTWKALFESTNTYPGTLIRLGSTGQNVIKLQQKLNELGFNAGSADGIFGNGTKTAVMNFQRAKGLDVDGIVGQMTWNLLFAKDEVNVPSIPDNEEPSVPDKEESEVQKPSDLIDKDNSVEEDSNKDNSIEEDNKDDNLVDVDNSIDSSEKDNNVIDVPSTNRPSGSGTSNSRPEINKPGTISAGELVNYSYKYLGCPYVWGATGPNSFDSSGFTQYIYKNAAGIDIGRTTYDQLTKGIAVSQSELQPGDLVFPHTGHVGIYVGNGKMIHAPQTGEIVKVGNVYKFYTARRII